MAIQPWLPGFKLVDLDLTGIQAPEVGRAYDETSHPKICLHTTEGGSLDGAERAFAAYPPHIGVDPATGERHQYLPLDRCSFSLRGSESDDEFVVQVEIVARAANIRSMPADRLDWLGRHVVGPIARAVSAPLVGPPQGFKAPSDVTYRLATATSPLRFRSEADLRAFSGVMGHQHAPAPDEHWDPGGIDIDRILTAARGDDDVSLTADEKKALASIPQLHTKLGQVVGLLTNDDLPRSPAARAKEGLIILRTLAGRDGDVDEAEVARQLAPLVLAGMPVDEIAAAVVTALPDDQAQGFLDALAVRLGN